MNQKLRSFLRRVAGVLLAPLGLVTVQDAEANKDRLVREFMNKFPGKCYFHSIPSGTVPTVLGDKSLREVRDKLLIRSGTKRRGRKDNHYDLYICRDEQRTT